MDLSYENTKCTICQNELGPDRYESTNGYFCSKCFNLYGYKVPTENASKSNTDANTDTIISDIIRKMSDKQLSDIIIDEKDEYTEKSKQAAIIEINRRKLINPDRIKPDEIDFQKQILNVAISIDSRLKNIEQNAKIAASSSRTTKNIMVFFLTVFIISAAIGLIWFFNVLIAANSLMNYHTQAPFLH
jgi:ATP-dependent Zn protease